MPSADCTGWCHTGAGPVPQEAEEHWKGKVIPECKVLVIYALAVAVCNVHALYAGAVKLDYSIPPAEVSSVTSGGRRFYKVTVSHYQSIL